MADGTVDKSQHIPVYEKVGYSFADAAANFVFMSMILFQAAFYTDVMGLKAEWAFYIILIPRLWDAFFDPIMGILADRTRTRWGNFRPWVLWTALPWGIIMFLAYSKPSGWSDVALITYAVVTNTLLMTLYSANNMPYAALGGVMSADIQERSKLNSFRFVAVNAAQFIVGGFTLVLVGKYAGPATATMPKGDLAQGWRWTMGIYAVVCVVCFLITFLTTKERVKPSVQKSSIRADFGDLLKNSPWAVMALMTLVHFAILAYRGGAMYQYFQLYVDKGAMYDLLHTLGLTAPALAPGQAAPGGLLEMLGYIFHGERGDPLANPANAAYGIVNMLGTSTTIIAIMFSPMLAKKFGKKAICVVGFSLMILNSAAFYLLKPTDVPMMIVLTVTQSIFYGPTIPLVWAIFADVADYSEWKFGRRATGTIFATIGFALKAGLALGASALLMVQSQMGYDPNVNNPKITEMFRVSSTLVPAGLFAICSILLIAYKLNKKTTIQIVDELAQRRKQAQAPATA
jgi:glycoside/pentoside/hexuronide:cation symporter, GPH family